MTLYPAEGQRYRITEWDGSVNEVFIACVEEHLITMRYNDGLQHEVAPDYFAFHLNPYPVPQPKSWAYFNQFN